MRRWLLFFILSSPFLLFAGTDWEALSRAMYVGNYAEAEALVRKGSELHTNSVHQAALGLVLTKRRQYPKAEKAFLQACKLEPMNPNHQWNLAEFYYLTGSYKQSAATYATIPPDHKQAHLAQYKEILSLLLSNQREQATIKVSVLRFDERNPLYLHAHAALRFSRAEMKKGRWFTETARSLYEPSGVRIYRQPLIDLGWLSSD